MDERLVDVAHEALIRAWPRLQKWIEDDRVDLVALHRVTESATEWRRLERDESVLYRGTKLVQALEWKTRNEARLNDLEREFLDASVALREREHAARERERAEQERERAARIRRRRLTIAGIGTGVVIAAGLVWQWRERQLVLLARDLEIQSRHELTQEGPADGLVKGTLLAVQSLNAAPTTEVVSLLHRGMDVLARAPLATRTVTGVNVDVMAFSSDGRWLAVGGGATVAVLDSGGLGVQKLLKVTGPLRSLVFSPDRRWLVTACGGEAIVWETTSWAPKARLRHGTSIWSMTFSPDGRRLASASYHSRAVKVFRTNDWVEEDSLVVGNSQAFGVAFSPDGTLLAVAADMLGFWRVGDRLRRVVHVSSDTLRSARTIAFSPNGRWLAADQRGGQRELRVFELGVKRDTVTLSGLLGGALVSQLAVIAFSADSRYAATGGSAQFAPGYGPVRVWDVTSQREVARVVAPRATLAFGPDGKSLVTGDHTGKIAWWVPAAGPDVARLAPGTMTNSVAFNSTDEWLATGSDDGAVRVFRAATWQPVANMPADRRVRHAAFSPDDRWLAAATDGGVSVFDTRTWTRKFAQPSSDSVTHVSFSPDSRWLIAIGPDSVRFFPADNWAATHVISYSGTLTALSFSPDGKRVATHVSAVSTRAHRYDITTPVWDLATGREISTGAPNDTTAEPVRDSATPEVARPARTDSTAENATWSETSVAPSDSVDSRNRRWRVVAGADSVVHVMALTAPDLLVEACVRLAGTVTTDSLEVVRAKACRSHRKVRQ